MSANEIVWLLLLLMTAVFLVIGLAVDFRAAKITGGGYADSDKPFSGYEPKTIAAFATTKHVCELMDLSDHRYRPARPEAVSR